MTDPMLWFANRGTGVVLLVLLTFSTILGVLSGARVTTRIWPRMLSRPDLVEHADDLDVELFDFRALKDGQAVALHPRFDLRQRHGLGHGRARNQDE